MYFWPQSGTLSEVGAGAAAGAAGGAAGTSGAGMMPGPNQGEVALSRAETAALAALESEDDVEHGLRRAQAESGLNRQQIQTLQRRATTLSQKGYTLKGLNFVKRPLGSAPDEPGLTRKGVKGEDAADAGKKASTKPAAKPAAKKTAETALIVGRPGVATIERTVTGPELYSCPSMDAHRIPQRSSDYDLDDPYNEKRESNTMSTLASMLSNRRHKALRRGAA